VTVLQLLSVAGGGKGGGGRRGERRGRLGVGDSYVNSVVGACAGVRAGDVRAGTGAQETGVLHLYRESRLTSNGCHLTLKGVVNVGSSTTAGAAEDVGGDGRVKRGGCAAGAGRLGKKLREGEPKTEGREGTERVRVKLGSGRGRGK
jgi:hypothetical protein